MTRNDNGLVRRPEYLATLLVLLIVYFLAGKLGLKLAFVHANATAVWPPTGIALASLLVLGYRVWPAIFLGAFLVNITTPPSSLATSIGIACGNTLEGLLGACLVNKFADGRNAFSHPRTVFKFAALAAVVSTTVSATIGVTSLSLGGSADWNNYGPIWLTWWLGDAVGALIVAPLCILWSTRQGVHWNRAKVLEAVLMLLVLALVGQVEFAGLFPTDKTNYPLTFLCIPPVVWAAFRFGQRETVTVGCLLSGIAVWGTLHGFGPFVGDTRNQSLIFLQAFMGVIVVMAMAVSAVVGEHRRAEDELRKAQNDLERRVNERTAELAKANLALHTSREQLAEAQQIAQIGSWEWDMEKDVVSWSDELYRIYGLKPRELSLTYDRFLERVHPEDRSAAREAVEGARQDLRPFGFDHRIIRPDGTERVLHKRGEVVVDQNGRAARMIGTGQDVTEGRLAEQALCNAHIELEKRVQERTAELAAANDAFMAEIVEHKQTAEALRDSRTRFQAIFENSMDAIGVSKNGAHVLANPAYLKMFGYSRMEEIAGKAVLESVAPSERELIRERIHRRTTGADAPVHYVTRGLRKDRSEFDLEVDVSSYKLKGEVYTLVILRDVTERKRAEEMRNQLAAIVESSDDAIISRTLEGIIVSWNAGAERIFGYPAAEVIGKPIAMLVPSELLGEEAQILKKLKRGEELVHYETRRLRKDGSIIDMSLTMSPVKDSAGRTTGVSKIARDITGRKRAEEEIRNLNAELERRVVERTAQLEAINQELESFTYSVSHDLRAPLRAMQGLANALLEDYVNCLDETGRDYAHRIVSAAGRMELLIQDLLAYSRLSRVDLELRPVNLDQVVIEVQHQLELNTPERGAQVTVEGALPSVAGHRATLIQVVGNLVSNGIKFVAPGVTPRVRLRAEEQGERVRLWVEDNGIGIAPEYQERVFRIFERLHGVETYPGTGIGLAIVQKGVERLGGRVGLESALNCGSKFWVELKKA